MGGSSSISYYARQFLPKFSKLEFSAIESIGGNIYDDDIGYTTGPYEIPSLFKLFIRAENTTFFPVT